MYFLYSLLTLVAFVLMSPYFLYQAIRYKKYIGGLRQRLGFLPLTFNIDGEESLWIHAVSVGETLTARALAADLKARYPHLRLFLSTTTIAGQQVAAHVQQLQLEPRHALVVYDDMDLPFGALRLRERGSPGTHNGMRSVVAELGSPDIPRLRMGISQASNGVAIDHVLGEFELADRPAVDDLIRRTADAVQGWAILGSAKAMNRYNKG